MKAEKTQKVVSSRAIQSQGNGRGLILKDNRLIQAKMTNVIQRAKEEVIRFIDLSSDEKNDLANGVRLQDFMYTKGYQEVDDYYGIVYFNCDTTSILLEKLFNDFSENRYLRVNLENKKALFEFMGFRFANKIAPTAPVPVLAPIIQQHGDVTFTLPLDIINRIMHDYRCSFDTIENAMGKIAASQGGVGIRVNMNAGGYVSELKIQAMGDYRVFTRQMGANQTFNIIARGIH